MKTGVEIYNNLSRPPKEALRTIQGGKLSRMTDINPRNGVIKL